MSQRLAILEALQLRVQAITPGNGYQTEAGLAVYLGETPQLGLDDPETAIAIVMGDTEPAANRVERWALEVQALAKADIDQPHLAALVIWGDIVQAVEVDDRTLGGLVKDMAIGPLRTLPREPGSTTVGIAQTYVLTQIRVWGTA